MRPSELIGKKAIRTGPNSNGDYSYTDEPLIILAVTESHVIYKHPRDSFLGKLLKDESKTRILDCRWLDDNWTDYDQLMALAEAEAAKLIEVHDETEQSPQEESQNGVLPDSFF